MKLAVLSLVVLTLQWMGQARAEITDWEIVRFKGRVGTYLRSKHDSRLTISIMDDFARSAELVSAKRLRVNNRVERIIYCAGDFGTSKVEKIYRAILFDTVTKKIFGEFPIAASEANPALDTRPFEAKWVERPGTIVVSEPLDAGGPIMSTEIDVTTGRVAAQEQPGREKKSVSPERKKRLSI